LVLATACAVAVVLSTACDGSTSGDAAPTTPAFGSGLIQVPGTDVTAKALPRGDIEQAIEVAQAIKASGLGCDRASLDWQGIPPEQRPPDLPDQVSCDVGGNTLAITRFEDHDLWSDNPAALKNEVCASSPPAVVRYVAGTNWVVFPGTPDSGDTARRLAEVLPGELRTIRC
jgi:hypothetical protein